MALYRFFRWIIFASSVCCFRVVSLPVSIFEFDFVLVYILVFVLYLLNFFPVCHFWVHWHYCHRWSGYLLWRIRLSRLSLRSLCSFVSFQSILWLIEFCFYQINHSSFSNTRVLVQISNVLTKPAKSNYSYLLLTGQLNYVIVSTDAYNFFNSS